MLGTYRKAGLTRSSVLILSQMHLLGTNNERQFVSRPDASPLYKQMCDSIGFNLRVYRQAGTISHILTQ